MVEGRLCRPAQISHLVVRGVAKGLSPCFVPAMEGTGGSVLSLQFDPTTSGITIGSRRPAGGPTRRPPGWSASSTRSAGITCRRSATVGDNAHGRRTVWVTFRCWRLSSRGCGKHVDDDTLPEGWYLDRYGVISSDGSPKLGPPTSCETMIRSAGTSHSRSATITPRR